jgi:hypothetical protein
MFCLEKVYDTVILNRQNGLKMADWPVGSGDL